MSKDIKNTLFRFATMRAPELIDSSQELEGFVRHPNITNSVFFNATKETTESSERKAALQKVSESFVEQSFKTRDDIKKMVGDSYYDFSKWLIQSRVNLKVDDAIKKIEKVELLNTELITQIWDNLFYQIITYKSGSVREVLFSLLTADFFIKKINETDKTDIAYQELAQVRIVVPNNLFELDSAIGGVKKNAVPNTKSLDKELNTIILNDKIQYLKKIKTDAEKAKKSYDKEQASAYEIAYEAYQKTVKELNDAVKPEEQVYTDPEINVQKKYITYPDASIPDFTFKPAPELDAKTLARLIPNETQSFINEIVDSEGYTTYDEVIDYVDNEINTTTETLFENATLEDTVVNYNGTLVPVSTDVPTGPIFSISGTQITPTTLLFNTDFLNAHVVSANYQITFITSGETISGSTYLDTIVNNKLSVKIFTNNEVNFSGKGSFRITGEFTLNNNRKITLTGTARVQPIIIGGIIPIPIGYQILGNGSYTVEILSDDGSGTGTTDTDGTIEYIPSGYGIKRIGIADYRKVEQTICCYVPGEVSHIENIMAREFKEKETRRLRRREDTTSSSTEKETEQLTDTTTTDRFEMNQEIASIIAEDTQMGASVNASYSGPAGPGTLTVGGGADFSTATSTEESNSQSVTYAKEVTERALDRVVQKVKEERTIKVIEEYQEKNVHGFDNRQGENHISGVYRWIDKIYKNQVINYGKRLMYEFMIPEPAAFHNIAIEGVSLNPDDSLVKPKDPRTVEGVLNLKDYTKITQATYAHWAGLYNAEVNAAPKHQLSVSKGFSGDYTKTGYFTAGSDTIKIPDGYEVNSAKASVSFDFHPTGMEGSGVSINIGDKYYNYQWHRHFNKQSLSFNSLGGIQNELAVAYKAFDCGTFSMTVVANCTRTDEAYKQWQIETFNAIISAYENKLAEYNSRATEVKDFGVNPGFFRQIESNVLRKNCIEYLASHANVGIDFILDRTDVENTRADYQNSALETYAARVKFFEQAFEWSIISYNFYPFYWADKSKWKSLYNVTEYNVTEFNDPLHRAFLQSGMARVIVTVKPGFEEVVNWYMATGQIWNGGQVPTMDDELFLSIVDELQEPEGVIEETWETRVPTSLTVIQAGAIGLNVEGLPCNSDCDDFKLFDSDGNEILDEDGNSFTNPLEQTNAQIGGSSQEETTP
ncbi:MAG: hypothetical protein ACK5M1_07110 [Xanthomarina gelatinilytica]|uniref:hypothetical protein n=1 Tax=Xanthomarina gelatinilytica TaxID=1137281 RepID=UPI003A8717AF